MLRTKQFSTYEIVRKLGRGMTDVYLAFDTEKQRHAVLKIIEDSPDSFTQLVMHAERRGAELQRDLHRLDPRILEVYDYGELDGFFFLAIEYMEGRTVAEILHEEKRLDPQRAARFAAEICSQLDRLHSFVADIDGQRRAVVHGDIKPSNIQIGPQDEVRLLDFGIAKAITFTHNLTHHNLGSPSYCSAERLSRGQVDHHSDLWALAVTLYEMVAGTPPYQAQDTRKLEMLIQSRRPPRDLPADCPIGLKAIIRKALAGEQKQRYATAAAFGADLDRFLAGQPTEAEASKGSVWNSSATVEKAAPPKRTAAAGSPTIASRPAAIASSPKRSWRPTAVISRLRPDWPAQKIGAALSVFGALSWGLLAGLVLFIPAGLYSRYRVQSQPLQHLDFAPKDIAQMTGDWNLYQHLKQHNHFLGPLSPANSLDQPMRAELASTADEIIDHYRTSNDPNLNDFDWAKARWCLEHLLEIAPDDRSAKGKLLLTQGFESLARQQAQPANKDFQQAAALIPRAPEPHMGLAWIRVYALRNVGEAVSELHQAQRLGLQLGAREMEEQADAYRFRAIEELNEARKSAADDQRRLLELSQRDFDRARQLYEPILGFSGAGVALRQVNDGDRSRQQLDAMLNQPPAPPAKPAKLVRTRINAHTRSAAPPKRHIARLRH